MPRQRFERHEPTHDWRQLRSLLKDSAQITYEIIRPVILGWETPKERSAETGMPKRTIYYKANLFDQAGMASLLLPVGAVSSALVRGREVLGHANPWRRDDLLGLRD